MKKILIVEDESTLANMYADKMQSEGFEVLQARSNEEAIKQTTDHNPDLILLDILLGDENGVDFLKAKHENKSVAAIPVVAFSNYQDPDTKAEAKKLGAVAYLLKTDYTPDQMMETLKSYIPADT